jgi:hypothetical protein
MDRAALLADILPPPAPPALPPAPWWSQPAPWLALAAAVVLALLAAWAWRQSRPWRRLAAAAADAALKAEADPRAAALLLAANLRAVLPEAQWPPPLRALLDALRYAPDDAQVAPQTARVAREIEQAARRAAARAWRGQRSAQHALVLALQRACWPDDERAGTAPVRRATEVAR